MWRLFEEFTGTATLRTQLDILREPDSNHFGSTQSAVEETHPPTMQWRHQQYLMQLESAVKVGFHYRRSWSSSRKQSHKRNEIGVGRIRTFPLSYASAFDSVAYDPVKTGLLESEAETKHNSYSHAL